MIFLFRTHGDLNSLSLIERVILSAGAMLIFSVSFQIDQMPEGDVPCLTEIYNVKKFLTHDYSNVITC